MTCRIIHSSTLTLVTALSIIHAAEAPRFFRDPVLDNALYVRSSWIGGGGGRTVLAALPSFYSCALSDRLSVDAGTIPAIASSTMDESSVVRVSNTKLRFSYNWADLALATLGFKIPTGFNQLTGPQLATAGNLSTRQLNFQYANLFNSLDVCAGMATSLGIADIGTGDLSIGLGVAGLYKSPFHPSVEGSQPFDPGDELNFSVAAEYAAPVFDRPSSLLIDIGYTWFGADRFGTVAAIAPGSKFNWSCNAQIQAFKRTAIPFSLRIANFRKGANVDRDRNGETSRKANDLILWTTSGLPLMQKINPYVKAGFSTFSGGGSVTTDSIQTRLGMAGLGGSARFGEHIFASFEAGVDAGTFGGDRLLGLELLAGLSFRF